MTEKEMPSVTGVQIVLALQRGGWVVVHQKGIHIRLQKHTVAETLKLIIPAHRPVKKSTLSHILTQANLSMDDFLRLV
jgi:predicted RNA binding protein YcfA (HicA-like mRNA interferase family)